MLPTELPLLNILMLPLPMTHTDTRPTLDMFTTLIMVMDSTDSMVFMDTTDTTDTMPLHTQDITLPMLYMTQQLTTLMPPPPPMDPVMPTTPLMLMPRKEHTTIRLLPHTARSRTMKT